MSRIFFKIGPFVVECHGPHRISKILRSMWPPPDGPVPADLTCVFQTDRDGHGRLIIEHRVVLDDAEPEDLIGAAFAVILGRIHHGTSFCAMIHAAAVAAGESAIVVAAPSGSGKSTLTAYLAAHGYTYLSDDLVPLRALDHAVAPFPMPIRVKAGAVAALKPFYPHLQVDGHEQIQTIDQDMDFLTTPCRARMLLFPRYSAGAATTFDEIGVEAALIRLLADGIFFGYPIPPNMVASFLAWLKSVERRVLVYSDFAEAAECIAGTLRP